MLKTISSALCPHSALSSEMTLCGPYHPQFSPLVLDFYLATFVIHTFSPIQCCDYMKTDYIIYLIIFYSFLSRELVSQA